MRCVRLSQSSSSTRNDDRVSVERERHDNLGVCSGVLGADMVTMDESTLVIAGLKSKHVFSPEPDEPRGCPARCSHPRHMLTPGFARAGYPWTFNFKLGETECGRDQMYITCVPMK